MLPRDETEWIESIQRGDPVAWQQLIDHYEGRLLAFARRRIGDASAAEDVVQETFVGFLTSLPNYDRRRPLETYLFTICTYKLTDHLRRSGRRPTLPLLSRSHSNASASEIDPVGGARVASSIARSVERQQLEEKIVAGAIAEQIQRWRETGSYVKWQAIELLFVAGCSNMDVASKLGLTQQQIANFKSDFLTRIKAVIARQDLDVDVFPELTHANQD